MLIIKESICVEFKKRNNPTLFFLLAKCTQIFKILNDLSVKYYF